MTSENTKPLEGDDSCFHFKPHELDTSSRHKCTTCSAWYNLHMGLNQCQHLSKYIMLWCLLSHHDKSPVFNHICKPLYNKMIVICRILCTRKLRNVTDMSLLWSPAVCLHPTGRNTLFSDYWQISLDFVKILTSINNRNTLRLMR